MKIHEITAELVDQLAPQHTKFVFVRRNNRDVDCSDAYRGNGFRHRVYSGRNQPCCNRCALLDILEYEGGVVPRDLYVLVTTEVGIRG